MPTKDGWGVNEQGNSKLTAKTDTKADALKIGKEIAKNQQSELTFLGKDGKIQNKNSYGNDLQMELVIFCITIITMEKLI